MIGLEKQTYFYLDRIQQIDAMLEGPVQTLIRLANGIKEPGEKLGFPAVKLIYFPPWISEGVRPKESEHLTTWALCSATLQRVWRMRRRFTWLEKDLNILAPLDRDASLTFTPKRPSSFNQCFQLLKSHAFGALNPITASQVFRVFLNSSEAEAHSGMGFLAFFAMLWALHLRSPDAANIGAAIQPWEPSAYVTANCLLPIKTLQSICRRRAEVLREISEYLNKLWKPATNYLESKRGKHSMDLDELASKMLVLSEMSIERDSLRECALFLEKESAQISVHRDNQANYQKVLVECTKRLLSLGQREAAVLSKADGVLRALEIKIIRQLNPEEYKKLEKRGLNFTEEYVSGKYSRKYWKDLQTSARSSLDICREALEELKSAAQECEVKSRALPQLTLQKIVNKKNKTAFQGILKCLQKLLSANKAVADMMNDSVVEPANWCRQVVDRQISYVTAGNFTDFDPSELVSGLAVAVRWNLMPSELEVSNAIKKALEGARRDGSWSPGQPFYSSDYSTSISTKTSDIVWTLTRALEIYPSIHEADDALFEYVGWLKGTLIRVDSYVGWASDRLRHPRKIHLAATALAINALLEIRDLAEYRLWEVAKRRFSFVPVTKKLEDIKPLDLGAKLEKRLHGQIARIARMAQDENYGNAEYSIVLHGPPGSSKTMLAQALSDELWKNSSRWGRQEPRLIRITPGDFTRMGEARVDAEARFIFDLLSHVRGVTIFFDEIDDLLRRRDLKNVSLAFLDLVVPSMLNRLADLRESCPRQETCFLLATNCVEKMEPALIRKGRIDRAIPVVYPDKESRLEIIRELGCPKAKKIAKVTAGWPYLEILEVCKRMKAAPKQSDELLKEIEGREAQTPNYKDRLISREIVNEYLHCKIAEAWEGLEKCKEGVEKEWHKELERIWIDEGRPI